jgi:hypothetical protein
MTENVSYPGRPDSNINRTIQALDWNGNAITSKLSQPSPLASAPSANGVSPAQLSNHTASASATESILPHNNQGLSSSGGFLRTLLGADVARPSHDHAFHRPPSARRLSSLGVAGQVISNKPRSENLLLPPRREVNRLLHVYRKTHYPIFPLLDLNSFLADVDAVCRASSTVMNEQTLLSMLNFIFALATQSEPSEESDDDDGDPAESFFKRGSNLMSTDLLGGYTFSHLQATLLCAQFLLSTDKPQQCWILIGHSLRVAESLGLDRPSTAQDLESPAERALAKRIWHVCVSMDR